MNPNRPTKPSYATRTLADAVGSLRNAEGQCVVLIGAGCSLSAGIPLASGIIQEIKRVNPQAYERACRAATPKLPNYNQCMEELAPNERQRLLNGHIEKASVNWAHLALAQLFATGKVDRVLTVNFDPLLVRACAMVNFFPAIYDLAGNGQFKRHRIAPRSLFYLNGQHTGFVTLNAEEELQDHKEMLRTIVQETGVRRLWLIVGYSGEADPLLDVLTEQACFDGDLYWLGHSEEPSQRLLNSQLFKRGRHAFYVGGQEADVCLTSLAQGVQCFPPDLLVKPFDHLNKLGECINFESGGDTAQILQDGFRRTLALAADQETERHKNDLAEARRWLVAGEYERIINWHLNEKNPSDEAKDLVARAYLGSAKLLHFQTSDIKEEDISEKRGLWAKAGEMCSRALTIKPDKYEAACIWGIYLSIEASTVSLTDLTEARRLWMRAGEEFKRALTVNPDLSQATAGWAHALFAEARALQLIDRLEAQRLLKRSDDMYRRTLEIKPDMGEILHSWGLALACRAQIEAVNNLVNARHLWAMAGEKFDQALKENPTAHAIANNWGAALIHEAYATQDLSESTRREVLDKAQGVLEMHAALGQEFAKAVAYNLACVYALLGDPLKAVELLQVSFESDNLPTEWRTDKDLNPIRSSPEFQTWASAVDMG